MLAKSHRDWLELAVKKLARLLVISQLGHLGLSNGIEISIHLFATTM